MAATAAFWIAGLSTKGGATHRTAGRWFARLIYAAAWTGGALAVLTLVRPEWVRPGDQVGGPGAALDRHLAWLVLYVLVIIVAPVQHGLAVVRAGPSPLRVRSPLHAGLNVAAMIGTVVLLIATILWREWLFLVVVPIGFLVGLRNLLYAGRTTAAPADWEREHLTSLVTAGVTLHTAFFVFGTKRTLGLELEGVAAFLPWVVPAIVGLPIIARLRSRRI